MNDSFWATELKQMKTAAPAWAPALAGGLSGAATGALANYSRQMDARRDGIYDHPDQAEDIDAIPLNRMSMVGSALLPGALGAGVGHAFGTEAGVTTGLVGGSIMGSMDGREMGRRDVRNDVISRARRE